MMNLLLFHRDLDTSLACLDAGVDGVVIDLETRGKAERQSGFDTEINAHSISTLASLRARTEQRLLCRLSCPEPELIEISRVIDAGADEVILPMLTSAKQAQDTCEKIGNACKITLMVETESMACEASKINALPIARVYVGLNDLQISRNSTSIFAPMQDGLLDRLRQDIDIPDFGFAGITLPSKGAPLRAKHLYNEMMRLGARFTFLRRSFYRDTAEISFATAVTQIRNGLKVAQMRRKEEIETDHQAMTQAVLALMEAGTNA